MVLQYDVDTNKLVEAIAVRFSSMPEMEPPSWAAFVKTGAHKQRPPERQDWWFMRSAAVLLTVAKSGPIGVSKLRSKYGGKRDRGYKPDKFCKGSGSIIRNVLQQLEAMEYVKQAQKGVHKGRVITPKGQSLIDQAAKTLLGKKQEAGKSPDHKATDQKSADQKAEKAAEKKQKKSHPAQKEEPAEAPQKKAHDKKPAKTDQKTEAKTEQPVPETPSESPSEPPAEKAAEVQEPVQETEEEKPLPKNQKTPEPEALADKDPAVEQPAEEKPAPEKPAVEQPAEEEPAPLETSPSQDKPDESSGK
ncbi:30S ribosomal protein S19e [Candidatus Woesearchaeota archaeon CG_4_10_14_0_8_um_filter_47_5]|nr:MAG: 30S ribosomal protein S19e [Candidatus Woesearchaeota archaeon CG_4_10_14_0_8_um_filter_47_5]